MIDRNTLRHRRLPWWEDGDQRNRDHSPLRAARRLQAVRDSSGALPRVFERSGLMPVFPHERD